METGSSVETSSVRSGSAGGEGSSSYWEMATGINGERTKAQNAGSSFSAIIPSFSSVVSPQVGFLYGLLAITRKICYGAPSPTSCLMLEIYLDFVYGVSL